MAKQKPTEILGEFEWRGWRAVVTAAGLPAERIDHEQAAHALAIELVRVWNIPEPERSPEDVARYGGALQRVAAALWSPGHPRDFLSVARDATWNEAARRQVLAGIPTGGFASYDEPVNMAHDAQLARLLRAAEGK